jgi:hypothetical protein
VITPTMAGNKLDPDQKQELNMTFNNPNGSRLDLRIETHKLSPKVGGDAKTPQRHLNVDVYNKSGNKVRMENLNRGHKILE